MENYFANFASRCTMPFTKALFGLLVSLTILGQVSYAQVVTIEDLMRNSTEPKESINKDLASYQLQNKYQEMQKQTKEARSEEPRILGYSIYDGNYALVERHSTSYKDPSRLPQLPAGRYTIVHHTTTGNRGRSIWVKP